VDSPIWIFAASCRDNLQFSETINARGLDKALGKAKIPENSAKSVPPL
jgi:hypothetical protein